MKLRVQGNSIRLRLSQREVALFGEAGRVEDRVEFGAGNALVYALERSDDAATQAEFHGGVIRVLLPQAVAREWVSSDQVGVEGAQGRLSIVVEKDFKCLHRPGGLVDDEDGFPNPLESSVA
jgi:uncharacterized protein DUF7009